MQRLFRYLALVLALSLTLVFTACGGGDGDGDGGSDNEVAEVRISQNFISLNKGGTQQLLIAVLNEDEEQIFNFDNPEFHITGDDVITLPPEDDSDSGLICAGDWDEDIISCTPKEDDPVGVATITVVVEGVSSDPIQVFVHERIDNIEITPGTGTCISKGDSSDFVATAYSNDPQVCAAQGDTAPCDITDTVGRFQWSFSNGAVGELDEDAYEGDDPVENNVGRLLGNIPGVSQVFANISGVNSTASDFSTCSPASITLHVKDSDDTEFTLEDIEDEEEIEAEIVDTEGNTITNLPLAYLRSHQPVVGISDAANDEDEEEGEEDDDAVVTATEPGSTGIVAACSPPFCNIGLTESIFSNVVLAHVEGTNDTTVFVASSADATGDDPDDTEDDETRQIFPIDTSTNDVGEPVDLPVGATLNSMVFSPTGTRIFIGTQLGVVVFNAASRTLLEGSPFDSAPGEVLAVGPNGATAIISDRENPDADERRVYLFNAGDNSAIELDIPDATAARYSADGVRIFIVAGDDLHVYTPLEDRLETFPLNGTGEDVAMTGSSAFAYVTDNDLTRIATCDLSTVDVTSPTDPSLIENIPDGSGMLIVDSPGIDEMAVNEDLEIGCPPGAVENLTSHNFGQGAFTPRQLIVTPDGSKAFVLSNLNRLLVYDIGANTTTTINLAGGATGSFMGDVTLDSDSLYVGTSGDNRVHRINVGNNTDAEQININFTDCTGCTPDLLVVQPRDNDED